MRHKHSGRKFNRTKDQRQALLKNLIISLVQSKSISSTLPKCKSLRPVIEKLLTIARNDNLPNRRLLLSRLFNHNDTVNELIKIASTYMNRAGGYTRVIKAGFRYGDNAPLGIIQFVGYEPTVEKKDMQSEADV